jgi:hypothetical protein
MVSFALIALIAGCSSSGPKSRPTALAPLAAHFKTKAGTERVDEARKIAALMPTCPTIHDNKMWWLMFGLDESRHTDWNHPSYYFAKDDLLSLLGPPDHEHVFYTGDHWDNAMYRVGHNRKGETMGLYVDSFEGHVVLSFLMPTNTPEMIQTHSHPGGPPTVTTNYVE